MRYFSIVVLLTACLGVSPASAQPLHTRIDASIAAQANGPLGPASSDAEFVRRVYLDLSGVIPTAADAQAFLADKDPQKRVKLIDRLLAAPEFGRRMEEALTSMLLERRKETTVADADWSVYLSTSFNQGKPWDQLVRELLFADDEPALLPARKFFLAAGRKDPHQRTQDVSRIFLGRDITCAQCHDHPVVSHYYQADYYGLYSYLQEKPEQAKNEFESVFVPGKHSTFPRLPDAEEVEIPTFTKEQKEEAQSYRPRLLLSRDLPTAENSLFVQNSVNRFWFMMMGRGLVHPLDMLHPDNPPSHPQVLDALAQEFVAHKFDVKHIIREIALTQAYQRTGVLPSGSDEPVPVDSYRVALAKPLSPEMMAWSVMRATGNLKAMQAANLPADDAYNYYDYLNGRIDAPPKTIPDVHKLFIGVFGNSPGEAEVEFSASMSHSLFLMNERLMLNWLEPQPGNLVDTLGKQKETDALLDTLYLHVLTRQPTDAERSRMAEHLEQNPKRRTAALGELVWALITSTEFRLNH
ncbi:DUF1549 domain-containing protein [Lignipirellula cremea]|uniref:Cytochrome c domain-containing protein n=1 Tax=Lignipirellula cremea TaxID=2528010 RepID=A0A518DVR8_9BACT|nr:DUF1549 domain-containing protein [Lignipirellula cremea]QDU95931.1 hypothetical protein Pla8534_37500 [Lignipirellula cremea]